MSVEVTKQLEQSGGPPNLALDGHPQGSQAARENLDNLGVVDSEPKIFELSIFIPRPNFCPDVKLPPFMLPDGTPADDSSYIELILPAQGQETIRELQQSVIESAEGWWLGSFALASVELDDVGKPAPRQLATRTVYGEFSELATAFQAEKFKESGLKRALLAVNIDYTEYTARLHVIRMRDMLYSQAPGLSVGNTTPFPAYEPSQIGICASISLFPLIRGDNVQQALTLGDVVEGEQPNESGDQNKDKKALTQTSSQGPSSQASRAESAIQGLSGWQFNPSKPFGAFDSLRQDQIEESDRHPPKKYLKVFALSNWNTPPHHYRLRGHYLYLAVTTLENESYEITGHTKGFYVNKSTKSNFDPSPRFDDPARSTYPHTLAQLLCTLSPLFAARLAETWTRALSPVFPDFFTSIAITNCMPAYPWLVDPEKPSPDAIRTQLAFLMTGSTTAETLPSARDWADEFAQTRELPRKTLAERTLRERIWSRLQSDFSLSATRGVISCSRGEVPPLNPQEPESAWTYVLNNILFSRAEDPIGAYEHLGGTAAARAIASKDLWSIKRLNELDVPGIYTMGSAVVDYHGKRWIAQGMIPGIFRPPDLEAENAKNKQRAIRTCDEQDGRDSRDEAEWEQINSEQGSTPRLPPPSRTPSESPDRPGYSATTYDILYGSTDIEKPEMGLRSDPTFHKLAKHVAAGFNLAEHDVIDINGQNHRLWLSADVHGIRATDGRCYLIDLYRMTPMDILFLENDLNGPILDGLTEVDELRAAGSDCNVEPGQDSFPHRFAAIRTEAIAAFKQHKFRQFALRHIQKHQQQQASQVVDGSQGDSISLGAPEGSAGKETEPCRTGGVTPEQAQPDEQFEFGLNPDAFVGRRGQPWKVAVEDEDESMAMVRELSRFVREQLLPTVVQELCEVKGLPADGRRLSDLLHSHGINIRYMGLIAHRLQLIMGAADSKDDLIIILQAAVGMLQSEMAFRASKHILNRMLAATSEAEACACIAHFLNCLLGTLPAVPSTEACPESAASWRTCTRESLQADITVQVRRRFRYALPASFFTQRLPQTRLQMLREVCTRMGIQLALRDYQLAIPALDAHTNGLVHSTEDENSAEYVGSAGPVPVGAGKQIKKKKKSKSKKTPPGCLTPSASDGQIFSPSDVLNLVPIVQDSTCRSPVAEELYAEGRKAFASGDVGLGQELCTDALATYEQVFGSIHPEMCRHWHSLAIVYHQLSQRALVELSEYNERLLDLSTLYQTTKNEEERQRIRETIELLQKDRDPEGAKAEIDNYIQLAANNLRQSVIVAERVLGLDHPETIQQYSDLSVMEYHLGNTDTAVRYTKHALDLWHLVYGPGCHPTASASVTHAGVLVQSALDPTRSPQADSIFERSRALIGSFFGTESGRYAESTLILSQMFAQTGQRERAMKYGLEGTRLYMSRFGPEHEHTRHAQQLCDNISRSIEAQIRGDEERSARLAKRLGLDPKRAASLRARLVTSSSASGSAVSSGSSRRGHTDRGQLPEDAIMPKTSPPSAPNGKPVSIDELVKFIQGSPVKPSGPSKVSSSNSRSARQVGMVKGFESKIDKFGGI